MNNPAKKDVAAVLKGMQLVFDEVVKQSSRQGARSWQNSSVKKGLDNASKSEPHSGQVTKNDVSRSPFLSRI